MDKRPLSRAASLGTKKPTEHYTQIIRFESLLNTMVHDRTHHKSFLLMGKGLKSPDFPPVTRLDMEEELLQITKQGDLQALIEVAPEVFFVTLKDGETRDIFLYQHSNDIIIRKNKIDIDGKLTELASHICHDISNKLHSNRQVLGIMNPPSPTFGSSLKTVKCHFLVKPGFPILALRLRHLFDIGEADDAFPEFLKTNLNIKGNFVWTREVSKNNILTGVIYIHFESESHFIESLTKLILPMNLMYNSLPVHIDYIQ